MGAGSMTKMSEGHGTTAFTAPLRVLQARWARRSGAGAPFFALALVTASMLGPRGSLTLIVGSTGLSHSQQRQPARSPTSVRVLILRRYGVGRGTGAELVARRPIQVVQKLPPVADVGGSPRGGRCCAHPRAAGLPQHDEARMDRGRPTPSAGRPSEHAAYGSACSAAALSISAVCSSASLRSASTSMFRVNSQ